MIRLCYRKKNNRRFNEMFKTSAVLISILTIPCIHIKLSDIPRKYFDSGIK